MNERRKFRRIECADIAGKCRIQENDRAEPLCISVMDITPEGIGFSSPERLDNSSQVRIEIEIDGNLITCHGKLCWLRKNEFDDNYLGGFYITDISAYARSMLLIKYTNSLLSLYPEE